MEPISIISLAISVLSTSYNLYKKLSEKGIITHASALIDWENGSVEQQWTLGNKSSHVSLFNRTMQIHNVLNEVGTISSSNETNLFKLGLLSKEDNTLRINLKEIGNLDCSQTVVLRFTTPFDKNLLYNSLCEKNIQLIPQFVDERLSQYQFTVMLNWAHVWKEDYESVRFTNIMLDYNDIPLDKEILKDSLPQPLKEKLILNTRLALQKWNDALKYLHTLDEHIEKLQQEELKDKLSEFVHVESERAHASIHNIRCSVNSYTIGDGYPLLLPDLFHIRIACSIDAREQAVKGKVIFYRRELEKFVSKVFSEIDEKISSRSL